jgi:hypothetical protein
MACRDSSLMTVACIPFAARGKTRKWTTGTPSPQHNAKRAFRSTNGRDRNTALLRARAVTPTRPSPEGLVPRIIGRPTDTPNEVRAAFCSSVSAPRCLNRARFLQTNSTRSPSSDFGDNPRFRANVNRNSAFADAEVSARSLHQVGHAAFIARSLSPACLSCCRRFVALRSTWSSPCAYGHRRPGRKNHSSRGTSSSSPTIRPWRNSATTPHQVSAGVSTLSDCVKASTFDCVANAGSASLTQ